MITRTISPAIAAAVIILKPSSLTPFTALALIKLAEDAGITAGVINYTGDSNFIGNIMCTEYSKL